MATVYLGLGSNLGKRHEYLDRALEELQVAGIDIKKISTILETKPVDSPPQGLFLNAVLQAQTDHSPEELINIIRSIESKIGRVRRSFHEPRVIDIDILLYDDVKLVTKRLIIPHPRMLQRSFVMEPLKEIDPILCASLRL